MVRLRHAWLRRRETRAEARVYRLTGGRIVAGPFEGMQFVDDSDGIPLTPKLLGTYELELFPIIHRIARGDYDLIANIGAGEGYYAVGLLTLMPTARSVAFEIGERRRALIGQLARRNGVEQRITTYGLATTESLQSVLEDARQPVVLCDIEGAEKALLNPTAVSGLRHADILVEVHDFVDASISPTLRRRFETSHSIEVIASRDRTALDVDSTMIDTYTSLRELVSERRPCGMEWFWLSFDRTRRRASC